MNTETVVTSWKKINFQTSPELYFRANIVAEELNFSLSETIRIALEEFLKRYEAEKIQKELEEGYKANEAYYLKMNEEWKFADAE